MDSPHGQRGAMRGKPEALPAQTPDRGEPTMRKGSYSEELVRLMSTWKIFCCHPDGDTAGVKGLKHSLQIRNDVIKSKVFKQSGQDSKVQSKLSSKASG